MHFKVGAKHKHCFCGISKIQIVYYFFLTEQLITTKDSHYNIFQFMQFKYTNYLSNFLSAYIDFILLANLMAFKFDLS